MAKTLNLIMYSDILLTDRIEKILVKYRQTYGQRPEHLILDIETYRKLQEEYDFPLYKAITAYAGMRVLVWFVEHEVIECG